MSKAKTRFPVRILAATFLPHLSVSFALGSIGPLAPFIQESFHMTRAQIGVLTSSHSIGWIVMAIVAGSLVERMGTRAWLLISPVVSGICALLFSMITTFNQGIVIFFMLGIAFSFVNPATTKAIIQSFSRVRRGTAIAIKQTGASVGVFLAAASLPAIALAAGWGRGMLLVAAVNVALGFCGWALYNDRDGGCPGAENRAANSGNYKDNLRRLLHNQDFLLISFLQGVFNMAQFTVQSYLVLFLVESVGYSVIQAGFVMAVTQFCGIISRTGWGVASDFIYGGRRVPTLRAIGLTTVAGLVGLAFMSGATPTVVIWIVASLAGAGSIGFNGTAILLRAELAGKGLEATSTGMGMAISAWGVVVGPPLFGLIVDRTGSYGIAWQIMSAVILTATVLLRFVNEQKPLSKVEKTA